MIRSCRLLFLFASLNLLSSILPNVATAIIVSDRDHEYSVSPGDVAYGVNLDGVALIGTGRRDNSTLDDIFVERCTGALISDWHILSAAHCVDSDEDGEIDLEIRALPLVAGFEIPGRDVILRINTDLIYLQNTWPEDEVDVVILELTNRAPPDIPQYPLYGGRDEIGRPVVVAGYGATGFGDAGIDHVASGSYVKRAGLNRVEDFFDDHQVELGYDFDSGHMAQNALGIFGTESDLGFGSDEVLSSHGDLGGPIFIEGAIAGINAFNAWLPSADYNDAFDGSWGEVSYNTRVSSLRDYIHAATGGTASFVFPAGDFSQDGQLDIVDVDALSHAIADGNDEPEFDVTDDSLVDQEDLRHWVSALKHTFLGDANLDGEFNTDDLVQVFEFGEFEDEIVGNSTWSTGDWNADREFTTGDIVVAFIDGGFEQGYRQPSPSVPEPRSCQFFLLIVGIIESSRRRF